MSEDIKFGDVPQKPRRNWAAIVLLIFLAVALVGLAVYWLKPPVDAAKNFKVPKITGAYVDEEPFMRQILKPGDAYRPIEVMQGTTAPLECFVVKAQSTSPWFVVSAFGKTFEKNDCLFDLPVPTEVNEFHTVKIEYFEGKTKLVDTLEIPVVVVAKDERVEFHQLQDINHVAVQAGSVPDKIFIYGRAITQLPGESRDYGALFFTANPENDVPVVEMMPLHEGEKPAPLVGRVQRYRSYGKGLSGYAVWTTEPVAINAESRTITDLYIGVFKKTEIDAAFSKLLKVDATSADSVTVTPLVASPYEVLKLTYDGKLLSQGFHVVSGTNRAGIDSRVKAILSAVPAPTVGADGQPIPAGDSAAPVQPQPAAAEGQTAPAPTAP
jgi:hypothetical protein